MHARAVDFMDPHDSFPIQVAGFVNASGRHWTTDQLWAVPSATHLRHHMRSVFNDHSTALLRSHPARERMRQRYSREAVARIAADRLTRVAAEWGWV
jgi:hypothetical protein